MTALSEGNFHVLMGALLFASTFLDRAIAAVFPAWSPPGVGLVTLVLGLLWVGLFVGYRMRQHNDTLRVVADRLDRAERKIAALEAELARSR
jgi:hypothetical protein